MNSTLEKTFDQVRKAPKRQQERIMRVMLDELERDPVHEAKIDKAYAAHVQEKIARGEADIADGRSEPMQEFIPKLLAEMTGKHGKV